MTRICRICRLPSKDNKNVPFHRFPKNLEQRQKWASVLGVQQQQIGFWNYVCGNHFTCDSYIFSNERKVLKPNAIPIVVQYPDEESCSPIISTSACISDNYSSVNDIHSTPKMLNNNVIKYSDEESCSPIISTSASAIDNSRVGQRKKTNSALKSS